MIYLDGFFSVLVVGIQQLDRDKPNVLGRKYRLDRSQFDLMGDIWPPAKIQFWVQSYDNSHTDENL